MNNYCTVNRTDEYTEYLNENGYRHRTDGPAIEYANGDKQWWVNGKLHRTDGPAVEWAGGTKVWYVDGKRHRTDGPAVEWAGGTKVWYVDGKRHRTDGPAIIRGITSLVDGIKEYEFSWYVNGNYLTEAEFSKVYGISKIETTFTPKYKF